jgi:hypothetical protein
MSIENLTSKLADELFPIKKETDELDILDIPPEQRRLHTETYDFTVATIYDHLDRGDIYIPEFQRGYVWTRTQASRLIESLVIQCPIPIIYLNQDRDEKLSVIDGNQRLQSIKLFIKDEFPLRGFTTYPELEGSTFSQLDPRIRRHILNRTLRCIAILKDTHPQIKFEIFERLNTGAVQLNAQELRHGIYHGKMINLVDELTKEPLWKELSGITIDKRMKGSEIILRFFALKEKLSSYKKPLNAFLNEFCEDYQNASDAKILDLKTSFLNTLQNINRYLGSAAFRTFDENGNVIKSINTALYDAQMLGFSNVSLKNKNIEAPKLIESLRDLYKEEKFYESITAGTSATSLVKYRVKRFSEFLENI